MINIGSKKILHLIMGLELGGGAENMLLQLLPRMQNDLDNRVCVIMGRGEIGKKLEEQGIFVEYLELKNIFDLCVIFRYKKVLKEFKPDTQVNYLIHADIFGRIFGKLFGVKKVVPYIRNIHRNKKLLMFLDRMTLPLADFVLTNSETAKKYYIEKMGADEERIMCIPNGVDLARFENLNTDILQKKKEIGIPEDAFVIGTVARLEKQKDIPTLIKAFEMVQKKHPKAHLLIVGHGSQKENLKKMITDLNIEDRVTMLEKRIDVLELFQIMDIFVLPSLNEGMSNAILEAMASKRLIIVSDIEENMELVKDGLEGFNFSTGDFKNLADKISNVFYEDCEYYRENITKKIKNFYDGNIVAEKFSKFLCKI